MMKAQSGFFGVAVHQWAKTIDLLSMGHGEKQVESRHSTIADSCQPSCPCIACVIPRSGLLWCRS
jgi:hypothetical protein